MSTLNANKITPKVYVIFWRLSECMQKILLQSFINNKYISCIFITALRGTTELLYFWAKIWNILRKYFCTMVEMKTNLFTHPVSLRRRALPNLKQVLSPSQNARLRAKLSPRSKPVKRHTLLNPAISSQTDWFF